MRPESVNNHQAKKMVIVLGPHRSGTSLCAAAITSLGGELGFSSIYKNDENKKGFFEHPEIVSLNDRLLTHLGGSWDNPSFFGKEYLGDEQLYGFKEEALTIIERSFGESSFAVIKDPRICQLLPFWLEVLEASGYQQENIYCVHTIRHPAEVAASQAARTSKNSTFYEFGRLLEEGAALWLSLTVQSVCYDKKYSRMFVSYNNLLESPEAEIKKLTDYLNINAEPEYYLNFVADFVDKKLYRSKLDEKDVVRLNKYIPQVFEVYERLLAAAEGEYQTVLSDVAGIFGRADTQLNFYRSQTMAVSRLSNRLRESLSFIHIVEDKYKDAERQVAEIKAELEKQSAIYQHMLSEQARDYQEATKEEIYFLKCQARDLRAEMDKQIEAYQQASKEEIIFLKEQSDALRAELEKQSLLYREMLDSRDKSTRGR